MPNQDVPESSPELEPTEPEVPQEPQPVQPPKGFVPLAALHEERTKRQELESKLKELETSTPPDSEVFSDEGKVLANKISSLESELSELKTDNTKKDLLTAYPVLRDKWEDFEVFRQNPDNKGMNLRTAAKAFLIENGLLDAPRKGLEKPTGGARTPPTTGVTPEEIAHLRTTNFKEYQRLLKEGKIKV